jgi:hypothetical protein
MAGSMICKNTRRKKGKKEKKGESYRRKTAKGRNSRPSREYRVPSQTS